MLLPYGRLVLIVDHDFESRQYNLKSIERRFVF